MWEIVQKQLAELSWLKEYSPEWVIQLFAVTLITLLLHLLARRMLTRLQNRLTRTETPWDDAFIDALRAPLATLILILGAGLLVAIADEHGHTDWYPSIILPGQKIAIIALIAWFLVRFVTRAEQNILRAQTGRKRLDATTLDALSKIIRLAIFVTAGLMILQTLGVSIAGVLAFGGMGGIAVGFAAKDLLSNFFGALTIYFDQPFKKGDWIRSPDRDIEGTVEEIGWRQTRIRTFSKRPLYVPNAVFTTIAVENPQRMTNRRIYEYIGIRYDDIAQMSAITGAVRTMLQEHEEIDTQQTLMVNFDRFSASSCDFFIYCFTKTTDWVKFHGIKHEILLKISEIIASHGAEIAFPTSTLHIPEPVQLSRFSSSPDGNNNKQKTAA